MEDGVFRKELECLLSDAEAKTYSGELARQTQEQAELESRKAEVVAEYAGKIKACISLTRVIARKVSTGKEMRDVEVKWNYDFQSNIKTLERLDTYEIIDSKSLTETERQMQLDLPVTEPHQAEGLCIMTSVDVPCVDCGKCQEQPVEVTTEPV